MTLVSEHIWVDADEFQHRSDEALKKPSVGNLEAAHALYGGELLPEDRYEDWASARREYMAERHLDVLVALATTLAKQHDYAGAAQRLRTALLEDPAREDVHRHLMRLYAMSGNRHQSLRQYQACREALEQELGALPDSETEQLYETILSDSTTAHVFASVSPTKPSLPSVLRHRPATERIARETEFQRLLRSATEASKGRGGLVLVSGEAGVGKSRLVGDCARAAVKKSILVLWGTSYEQEGHLPYGAFVQALDSHLALQTLDARRALAQDNPTLRQLLPSLADTVHESTERSSVEVADAVTGRTRLFTEIVRVLDDLARTWPVLLVLDDLHVADAETLQLLHFLSRLAVERRWMIIGTYREEDVRSGSDLHLFLTSIRREQLCTDIALQRLPRRECDQMAALLLPGGDIAPSLQAQLYSLSLGNPLFLQELVRAMRDRGDIACAGNCWDTVSPTAANVPRHVRDLVLARVDRMDEHVRHTLTVVATVGLHCSFALLRAVARLDHVGLSLGEGQLLDALDRALHARILIEQNDGYAFRHPLLQAALYGRLSTPRRTRLHEMVARALEILSPNDIDALAFHYRQSEDQEKAAIYLEQAGDRACSIYAYSAAINNYQEARRLVKQRGGNPDCLSRLNQKLGDAHLSIGDLTSAQESFALAREQQSDPRKLFDAWRKEGVAWEKLGDYDRALAAIDAAQEVGEDLPDGSELPAAVRAELDLDRAWVYTRQRAFDRAEQLALGVLERFQDNSRCVTLARASMLLGTVAMQQGALPTAENYVRQSLALAEHLENLKGIASCCGNMSQLKLRQGDYVQAEAYEQRNLTISEQIGDRYAVAMCWNNLGVIAYEQEQYGHAVDAYRRSLTIRNQIGDNWGIAVCLVNLAEIAEHRGDFVAAETHYQQSLDVHESIKDQYGVAYCLYGLGNVAYHRGNLAEARQYYERSQAIRQEVGDKKGIVECTIQLSWVACEQNDPAKAAAMASQSRRLAQRAGAYDLVARAALSLGTTRLRTGRPRHAARIAEYAQTVAVRNHLRRISVQAKILLAHVRLFCGAYREAQAAADEAVSDARDLGMKFEEGIAHRLLGESLVAGSHFSLAVPELQTSERILESLGATLELARTRSRLTCVQACQNGSSALIDAETTN
ncbi:MAG: hypothetical protein NVS2B16_13260 [Chloroflexota bacterium]